MKTMHENENLPSGRRQHRFLRALLSTAVITTGCLFATTAVTRAQEVRVRIVEHIWGFDGSTTPGQFTPLSILLDNLSDEPIECTAHLSRAQAMSSVRGEHGAVLEIPQVYLTQHTRRWIQFYPYIQDQGFTGLEWRLTLIPRQGPVISFDPIAETAADSGNNNSDSAVSQYRQAVILDPTGTSVRAPTTVKHMPAEIFAPYATATTPLRYLFMDRVPSWEVPRQESLMSWLRCGGQLYLMNDANAQPLQFSGPLAPLNQPFESFRVGSGTVNRLSVQREGLTAPLLQTLLDSRRPGAEDDELEKIADQSNNSGLQWSQTSSDGDILAALRDLTQPEHAWWLIFLMSMVYIAMIFPGCWLLSRRRDLHFLTTYGVITGLAVLFSALFLFVGRRGYGEATSLHSLGVARHDHEGQWNLFEWNSLFVTSGDKYEITGTDQQCLLSTGDSELSGSALIASGNTAALAAAIPPFSAQTFLDRRQIHLPDWDLQVTQSEVTRDALVNLTVSCGAQFPRQDDMVVMFLYGQRIYRGVAAGNSLKAVGAVQVLSEYVRHNIWDESGSVGPFGFYEEPADDRPRDVRWYEAALPIAVRRCILDDGYSDAAKFQLPPDLVRAFIYVPVWDATQQNISHGPGELTACRHQGRILFVQDLPLVAESTSEP